MSRAKNLQTDELLDENVAEFLGRHPDYFVEHPELLVDLNIPHGSGAATSLVERQLALLREKNVALERKFAELVEVARDNDKLSEGVQSLGIGLIRARSLEEVVASLLGSLRQSFDADEPVLRIGVEGSSTSRLNHQDYLVEASDPGLKLFDELLKSRRPRCGRIAVAQAHYLFGDADEVSSAALVPLGGEQWQGVLAIAGRDPDHFQPGLGTLFLGRIGTLASAAIARHLDNCADV